MKTKPAPPWRAHMSVTIFGIAAAVVAAGLIQPAVSHAEKVWDIGVYDSCMKQAGQRYASGKTDVGQFEDEKVFCCTSSGGEWSASQGGCVAPPATFQTQQPKPGDVQAPRPGKAAST
ncbi:hypothetical protein [Mycobacterium sp. 1274761.0]|uniref:hypothetical protein n=1 Tax=Mycobacterium sp. 1274761.0 TaxID=1834077 RepID=UPI000A4B47D3|nr:hypothetical protein [Mycobacterium sp. 1274761.0]